MPLSLSVVRRETSAHWQKPRRCSCEPQKTSRTVVRRHRQGERTSGDRLATECIDRNRLVALCAVVQKNRVKGGTQRHRRIDNGSTWSPVGGRTGVGRFSTVRDGHTTSGVVRTRDFTGCVVDRITRAARSGSKVKSSLDGVLGRTATGYRGTKGVDTLQKLDFEGSADRLAVCDDKISIYVR